jgi:hypothetical protein
VRELALLAGGRLQPRIFELEGEGRAQLVGENADEPFRPQWSSAPYVNNLASLATASRSAGSIQC